MWDRVTKFFNRRLYRFLTEIFPPTKKPLLKKPKTILVFSTTGIGDALFDSAAIKSLKQGYPETKLIVCAHHRRTTVARHNPFVDEVIALSKSPFSQAKLLLRFWRKKPDLIVALRVNEEAVPLGYLLNRHAFVGAVERCHPLEFLLAYPVITKKEPHIVEETLKVAEAAGGATVDRGMVYRVHDQEKTSFYKQYPDLAKKPYVVFQTGGGKTMSWRDWPPEAYIQAIQWMRTRYPHHVILTGGHDNQAAGTTIGKACPEAINLVEKTTLEETAVLLQGAAMLVSSDTGVMHLGFAIGCPTLAILHYQSPASVYGPLDFSPGHEIIELSKPATSPSSFEGDMKAISFDQVKAAMERILMKK